MRFMRMLVFFDLPTTTREHQRRAAKFRKFLIEDGYFMVQYSVYARICVGEDGVQKHEKRLVDNLPPNGSVRMLTVTEKQYENIRILVGERVEEKEKPLQEMLINTLF